MNAKVQFTCEDLIDDLNGIHRKDWEWSKKRYRVDSNTFDTTLEWILKKYCVHNDVINTNLQWIVKRYRVDNDTNNNNSDSYYNDDESYGNIPVMVEVMQIIPHHYR